MIFIIDLIPGSGVTGVAHFDGCSTHQGVTDMVNRVCEMTQDVTDGRLVSPKNKVDLSCI